VAQVVVAVSETERRTFCEHGVAHVEVLGHCLEAAPQPPGLAGREGLLFVGAVHEDNSPNADSLVWFLTAIYPEIRAAVPAIRLTVAGVQRSERIRQLAADGVTLAGHLPSLDDLYARARVFVAPTRYAAGIPHKIHEAAAHGVPVVATPLLASQLGWGDRELAIAGDAAGFASRCVELCRDATKWTAQRDAALARVREECAPEAFERVVRRIVLGG
jgi:glycosyltransferase involved in cell wall biosynthesis